MILCESDKHIHISENAGSVFHHITNAEKHAQYVYVKEHNASQREMKNGNDDGLMS